MKTVSIIIPNYNGRNLLEENLPHVIAAIKLVKNGEIILVDDKSLDDSVQFVEKLFKNEKGFSYKIVKNEINEGFSKSVNQGVLDAKGDIIVLLNSDVKPAENFLSPLLSHFLEEKVFAVGCLELSREHGKEVANGRGVGKWEKGFLIHKRGEVNKNNSLWASGGSSAFKKNIWQILGGFDQIYHPFYWEDIDLSYRAQKAGYEVLFEKTSIVEHNHDQGAIKKNFSERYIKKIAYRNQFIFVWKNIASFELLISHVFWLPYHLITKIGQGDWQFIYGFLSAVICLPKILQRRVNVSSVEKVSDQSILKKFEMDWQKNL